jgi:hypothetical protein
MKPDEISGKNKKVIALIIVLTFVSFLHLVYTITYDFSYNHTVNNYL